MPAQDPYLFLRKCIKTIHAEDAGIAFFASEYAGLLLFLRAVGLFGNRNFGGETPFFVRKILPTAAMHGNGNRRATHLLGPYVASFFSRLYLDSNSFGSKDSGDGGAFYGKGTPKV